MRKEAGRKREDKEGRKEETAGKGRREEEGRNFIHVGIKLNDGRKERKGKRRGRERLRFYFGKLN